MAGQKKGLGTPVPGCNTSLPSDEGRARVPSLTINPPASPSCTRLRPSPGPWGRALGRGPNPRPPSKNLTDRPPCLRPNPLAGRRRKPVRPGRQGRRRRLRLRRGARGHPHFAVRAGETPRGSPAGQGHRARRGRGAPAPASGSPSRRRGARRARGAAPHAGPGPRARRTPRMLAGPRERGPRGRGSAAGSPPPVP